MPTTPTSHHHERDTRLCEDLGESLVRSVYPSSGGLPHADTHILLLQLAARPSSSTNRGPAQLGRGWGTARQPDCSGFSGGRTTGPRLSPAWTSPSSMRRSRQTSTLRTRSTVSPTGCPSVTSGKVDARLQWRRQFACARANQHSERFAWVPLRAPLGRMDADGHGGVSCLTLGGEPVTTLRPLLIAALAHGTAYGTLVGEAVPSVTQHFGFRPDRDRRAHGAPAGTVRLPTARIRHDHATRGDRPKTASTRTRSLGLSDRLLRNSNSRKGATHEVVARGAAARLSVGRAADGHRRRRERQRN